MPSNITLTTPLTGIYTGLKEIDGNYALILPCDSPYVTKNYIQRVWVWILNLLDFFFFFLFFLQLILVGGGAEHDKLVALAAGSANIEFVPTINDSKELAQLVSKARAFIFPSLEPFGIAPIEALSAGVPVIAYKKGGVLDYVIENKNGVFFPEQTAESLKKSVLLSFALNLKKVGCS